MNRFLYALMIFCFSSTSLAQDLPDWFKPRAKEIIVDRFVEAMKNYPEFYKIVGVTVTEGTLTSGQPAAFVEVEFNDSNNCSGRHYSGQCTPLNDGTTDYVLCFESMTACKPTAETSIFRKYTR